jgi:transposase
MNVIHSNAAGIDIGAEELFVSLGKGSVTKFRTFTEDLYSLKEYLISNCIETVAMEATGVYWINLYEVLADTGIDVWLVDGKETKQVPGRKTDVKDCQWIQKLHSYGLLKRCHVSTGDIRELRDYQRIREDHIRLKSMHINHMQKALIKMNIRLVQVISQIHGKSGMAIVNAILTGKRDKKYLMSLCHGRILKNKSEELSKALEGRYTEIGLFSLQQAKEGYDFYIEQIEKCDKEIEKLLIKINIDKAEPKHIKKRKNMKGNAPDINELGKHLLKIFDGKEATDIPGISDYTWLQLYGELGSDLSKWKTEKHFTSWLGLAPGQHSSGKMRKSKSRGKPRVGQIFRIIAQGLINSKKIAIGAFGRKLRGRKGPSIAIKAMARKVAVLYWRLMVKGRDYIEKGIAFYENQVKVNKHKALERLANELDVKLSFD